MSRQKPPAPIYLQDKIDEAVKDFDRRVKESIKEFLTDQRASRGKQGDKRK